MIELNSTALSTITGGRRPHGNNLNFGDIVFNNTTKINNFSFSISNANVSASSFLGDGIVNMNMNVNQFIF